MTGLNPGPSRSATDGRIDTHRSRIRFRADQEAVASPTGEAHPAERDEGRYPQMAPELRSQFKKGRQASVFAVEDFLLRYRRRIDRTEPARRHWASIHRIAQGFGMDTSTSRLDPYQSTIALVAALPDRNPHRPAAGSHSGDDVEELRRLASAIRQSRGRKRVRSVSIATSNRCWMPSRETRCGSV